MEIFDIIFWKTNLRVGLVNQSHGICIARNFLFITGAKRTSFDPLKKGCYFAVAELGPLDPCWGSDRFNGCENTKGGESLDAKLLHSFPQPLEFIYLSNKFYDMRVHISKPHPGLAGFCHPNLKVENPDPEGKSFGLWTPRSGFSTGPEDKISQWATKKHPIVYPIISIRGGQVKVKLGNNGYKNGYRTPISTDHERSGGLGLS